MFVERDIVEGVATAGEVRASDGYPEHSVFDASRPKVRPEQQQVKSKQCVI